MVSKILLVLTLIIGQMPVDIEMNDVGACPLELCVGPECGKE